MGSKGFIFYSLVNWWHWQGHEIDKSPVTHLMKCGKVSMIFPPYLQNINSHELLAVLCAPCNESTFSAWFLVMTPVLRVTIVCCPGSRSGASTTTCLWAGGLQFVTRTWRRTGTGSSLRRATSCPPSVLGATTAAPTSLSGWKVINNKLHSDFFHLGEEKRRIDHAPGQIKQ